MINPFLMKYQDFGGDFKVKSIYGTYINDPFFSQHPKVNCGLNYTSGKGEPKVTCELRYTDL